MEGQKEPPSAPPSVPVAYDNNPGMPPFQPAPPPIQPGEIPGSTLPQPGIYTQPPPAYQNVAYGQTPYQPQPARMYTLIGL